MTSFISFSQTIDSWYETARRPNLSKEEEIALFLSWQGIMAPGKAYTYPIRVVVLVTSIKARVERKRTCAEYSILSTPRLFFFFLFPLWLRGDEDKGQK